MLRTTIVDCVGLFMWVHLARVPYGVLAGSCQLEQALLPRECANCKLQVTSRHEHMRATQARSSCMLTCRPGVPGVSWSGAATGPAAALVPIRACIHAQAARCSCLGDILRLHDAQRGLVVSVCVSAHADVVGAYLLGPACLSSVCKAKCWR
jgi:hypothetical protein